MSFVKSAHSTPAPPNKWKHGLFCAQQRVLFHSAIWIIKFDNGCLVCLHNLLLIIPSIYHLMFPDCVCLLVFFNSYIQLANSQSLCQTSHIEMIETFFFFLLWCPPICVGSFYMFFWANKWWFILCNILYIMVVCNIRWKSTFFVWPWVRLHNWASYIKILKIGVCWMEIQHLLEFSQVIHIYMVPRPLVWSYISCCLYHLQRVFMPC